MGLTLWSIFARGASSRRDSSCFRSRDPRTLRLWRSVVSATRPGLRWRRSKRHADIARSVTDRSAGLPPRRDLARLGSGGGSLLRVRGLRACGLPVRAAFLGPLEALAQGIHEVDDDRLLVPALGNDMLAGR